MPAFCELGLTKLQASLRFVEPPSCAPFSRLILEGPLYPQPFKLLKQSTGHPLTTTQQPPTLRVVCVLAAGGSVGDLRWLAPAAPTAGAGTPGTDC